MSDLPDWRADLVGRIREYARNMRTESFRLEALADKIASPPEGVTVEYGGSDTVRFVTAMKP